MKKRHLVPVLLLVVFLSFLFFMKDINGARLEHELIYVAVEIENGDNLWDLAMEYNDTDYYTNNEYIDMIAEINNIHPDRITSGTTLIIPFIEKE